MLNSVLVTIALLAAGPQVEVQTTDQQTVQASLIKADETGLSLRAEGQERDLPLAALLRVTVPAAASLRPEKYNTLVELIDHSLLAATDYQTAGGTAQVVLVGGATVQVPTRLIRAVRFQAAGERDDKLNQQWAEILGTKAAGDMLVVRKKGALDYLEGVIKDLGKESLEFELDREPIQVKRVKVEGLVYYHAAGEPLPEAAVEVAMAGGTRLAARTARLAEDQWKIATAAGLDLSLPVGQVSELDYSAGKLRYLSDLEPELAQYTPLFPPKEPLASLDELLRPRRDMGLEQNPLKLDGKTYKKGLAVHSRSRVVYRLPGQFQHFQATVGIDDSVRDAGNAVLEIKADGKSLWRGTLRGTEPAQRLDLPIAGAGRLEIVVDFGDDLDIADHVDLCDAKVTR